MKIMAMLAFGTGLAVVPGIGSQGAQRSGLEEARTATPESLSDAIRFERLKEQRGRTEATRHRSNTREVGPDEVGSAAGSADRGEVESTVPAVGAKEYREWKEGQQRK